MEEESRPTDEVVRMLVESYGTNVVSVIHGNMRRFKYNNRGSDTKEHLITDAHPSQQSSMAASKGIIIRITGSFSYVVIAEMRLGKGGGWMPVKILLRRPTINYQRLAKDLGLFL